MAVTISGTGSITGAGLNKKIDAFTASGSWTVPAGVTYAIAHMLGGGGGAAGSSAVGGAGGNSSVAFASGTVTSLGGTGGRSTTPAADKANQQANSGRGGDNDSIDISGTDAQWNVVGATVTPAASITVTVGAGGVCPTSGFGDGGSGYVYIEYYAD